MYLPVRPRHPYLIRYDVYFLGGVAHWHPRPVYFTLTDSNQDSGLHQYDILGSSDTRSPVSSRNSFVWVSGLTYGVFLVRSRSIKYKTYWQRPGRLNQ